MGELRNCPACGKLFMRINRNLCPDCTEREEKEFETVRQYLKDNRGVSITKASEETGVESRKIIKWIREGLIEAEIHGIVFTCRRCGVEIGGGEFCPRCAQALASQFEQASGGTKKSGGQPEPKKGKDSKGMYIGDRLKE